MDTIGRLYGRITDFDGEPLQGAVVRLINDQFEDIYHTFTDKAGCYELLVRKGVYYTFYACRDYNVRFLEYWAWNVPLFDDFELNARIDGLEIYSLTAFRVKRGFPQLMLYFRPMSLKRSKAIDQSLGMQEGYSIIDISPDLSKEDIKVTINNEASEIYEVNKVAEYAGENQGIYAYLVHVSTNKALNIYEYNQINIKLFDKETKEKGEGVLFWKEERTL